MKTNSNSYTIIYSAVLVLVVAFLLAFVFQALKPMQDANVQLDQQKQILFALNQDRDMTDAQAVELWKKIIVADDVIDADGKVVETGRQGGVDAGFRLDSKDAKAGGRSSGPTSTTRARRPAWVRKSRTTPHGRRSSRASTSSPAATTGR